jgi:predicted TIM-barrel fold metal-dependent hydrolase
VTTRYQGGIFQYDDAQAGDEGATWADCWVYEESSSPIDRLFASAGIPHDRLKAEAITFEDMRRGCYDPSERLKDMDIAGIQASLCFPYFPRFAGQRFLDAQDKQLALLCIAAYNDWMVEEWVAPDRQRLLPLQIIPLWDAQLAAAEVYRNAARGVRAVSFTESPTLLGLPSLHDPERFWDPFLRSCHETGTAICMHIGSGSRVMTTSSDAPAAVSSTLTHTYASAALVDWLFSGVCERFPNLKVAFAEAQMGWVPYVLERADYVYRDKPDWNGLGGKLTRPPSEYFRDHVFVCFYDDPHGIQSLEAIGAQCVTFETDYPHSDSTWPDCASRAAAAVQGLDRETQTMILSGNAKRLLGL